MTTTLPPTNETLTRPNRDWAEIVGELSWIETDGDFREAAERLPSDRADAERLVSLIENQLPAEYWEREGDSAVALSEEDAGRLVELTGIL